MALPAKLSSWDGHKPMKNWKTIDFEKAVNKSKIWTKVREMLLPEEKKKEVQQIKQSVERSDSQMSPVYRNRRLPPVRSRCKYLPFPVEKTKPLPPIQQESSRCISICVPYSQKSSESLSTSGRCSSLLPPTCRYTGPCSKRLLRKPISGPSPVIEMNNPLFDMFTGRIDLIPLPFESPAAAFKFYNMSYPLLLQRPTAGEEPNALASSMRSRTPESPMAMMIQRKMALNQRVEELDDKLRDFMENEEDDIVTELFSTTFEPTKWSFYHVDQGSLRRRYTIEATVKELQNMTMRSGY